MKRKPATERFWKMVKVRSDGCWEWGGARNGGYGSFWLNPVTVLAHKFAYEEQYGPVPDGLELDHLCRNRLCVRPTHLEAVTHRENVVRGVNPAATHAALTHCPSGHAYDEENTHVSGRGWRYCRPCRNAQQNERRRLYGRSDRPYTMLASGESR